MPLCNNNIYYDAETLCEMLFDAVHLSNVLHERSTQHFLG